MAVIQYSALVEQMRGNLNGTVLSRYLGGYSAYKKGQPSRFGTEKQQLRRQQLAESARLWDLMTEQGRIDWSFIAANTSVKNRLGVDVNLSGFNYFVKFAQLEQMMEFPPNLEPETSLAKPYAWTIESDELNVTISGHSYFIENLHLRFEVTATTTTDTWEAVYISLPVPRADSNYDNTYYYVGRSSRDAGATIGQTWQRNFANVLMPDGWYTYANAYHHVIAKPLALLTGQEGLTASTVRAVQYTPPPPAVWPLLITFPALGNNYINLTDQGDGTAIATDGTTSATTSELLPGTATDYTVQLEFSSTVSASTTSAPSDFATGSEVMTSTMQFISSPPSQNFIPVSTPLMVIFINANFAYVPAQIGLYQPYRLRIAKNSDMLYTAWFYNSMHLA